jgi:putative lipoic acid-binding regulatory protein
VVDEIAPPNEEPKELLQFPTSYPIKVVGRRSDTMRANIDAIVRQHVPDLEESQIKERESNQHHFLSITYTINARSKEQVVELANALQASKDVIMLI